MHVLVVMCFFRCFGVVIICSAWLTSFLHFQLSERKTFTRKAVWHSILQVCVTVWTPTAGHRKTLKCTTNVRRTNRLNGITVDTKVSASVVYPLICEESLQHLLIRPRFSCQLPRDAMFLSLSHQHILLSFLPTTELSSPSLLYTSTPLDSLFPPNHPS